jgi:hypothetical protein
MENTDMFKDAKYALGNYYQHLHELRSLAIDTARAVVNYADTNPPLGNEKRKFYDGLYLARDGKQLVVWNYGPGSKYRIGPTFPTNEVEPIKVFMKKIHFAVRAAEQRNEFVDFLPRNFVEGRILLIESTTACFEQACEQVVKTGQEIAKVIAGNDQRTPFEVKRGHRPWESYRILYMNNGFLGYFPEEKDLIRLCGERVTNNYLHFEQFLRLLLTTPL